MSENLLKNNAARLLRTAIGALCLLQNPGCGGDAERDDAVPRADSGAPGGAAIPVVRMEAPSRETNALSGRAVDSRPEREAPVAADDETPEARGSYREESDPRLAQTLDPEDSAQRLAEISKLNAAGDDLDSVLDALESDPDPAVRVAAADLLAESQRREAIYGLLHALDDPSKEVVLQALETLSLVGEADIIPWVEPLLDHPDPDISGKAEDTIYFASPGEDESDPDYGKDFTWPNESDPEPDPGFDYNFGFGGDPEQ